MHIGDKVTELGGSEGPVTYKPFLYILMRTDLESMNPGKAVAQGAHAANQFVHHVEFYRTMVPTPDHMIKNIGLYDYWQSRTDQGFGTTICLDVNADMLYRVTEGAKSMNLIAGVTHDPSYPLRDGDVTHFIPLDSCGYVFGDQDELRILLGQFNLMP